MFFALPAISASAATEQKLIGYLGDISGDMQVDSADVHLLSDYLTKQETVDSSLNWAYADLDGSGTINVIDLTCRTRRRF